MYEIYLKTGWSWLEFLLSAVFSLSSSWSCPILFSNERTFRHFCFILTANRCPLDHRRLKAEVGYFYRKEVIVVTNREVYAGLCCFFYFQKRVMRCTDSVGNHSFKSGLLSITVLTIVSTYCCVKCNSCKLHGESSSKVGPMYRSYRTLSELRSEPNKAGKLLRSSKEINSYTRLWESQRFSSNNTDFGN